MTEVVELYDSNNLTYNLRLGLVNGKALNWLYYRLMVTEKKWKENSKVETRILPIIWECSRHKANRDF